MIAQARARAHVDSLTKQNRSRDYNMPMTSEKLAIESRSMRGYRFTSSRVSNMYANREIEKTYAEKTRRITLFLNYATNNSPVLSDTCRNSTITFQLASIKVASCYYTSRKTDEMKQKDLLRHFVTSTRRWQNSFVQISSFYLTFNGPQINEACSLLLE